MNYPRPILSRMVDENRTAIQQMSKAMDVMSTGMQRSLKEIVDEFRRQIATADLIMQCDFRVFREDNDDLPNL